MESVEVLQQNLAVARGFEKLTEERLAEIRDAARALAADGRFELYKTTKKYDGKIGREQHGFPTARSYRREVFDLPPERLV